MSSTHPLAGLTVIEIGHSIAAPYAGMILGELGAEIIKVENPKGGDACRGWGPPFTEGTATAFHAFNRAKRGITIDLTDPAQVATLHGLICDRADVLIHNLKHGTLDRYGLSAAELTAAKPSLVYCNIGAFGALAFDRPNDFIGLELEIAGSELTNVQAAEVFSRILGRRVKFQKLPLPIVRLLLGKELYQMFRWFNQSGFQADIPALKRCFPEVRLLSLEEWLREEGWQKRARILKPPSD